MAVTVKNESTGKVSLPRPFSKTLAAGASASVADLKLAELPASSRQRIEDLENAGLVTVSETDDALYRGSAQDASVADIHQIVTAGQPTAADAAVEVVAVAERRSYVKSLICYFDATPDTTETITMTLTRNGQSILQSAFAVGTADAFPTKAGVLLADDVDNTDGAVVTTDPNELNALSATFTAAHIGNLILINGGAVADGAYIISARTDADNVDLVDLEGNAAAWTVDETGLKWDMLLNIEPGDLLVLTGTMANNSLVGTWATQLVLVPR